MGCCGSSKSRAAQGVLLHDIQYIEAVYVGKSGVVGETSLYSSRKMDPSTRRKLLISAAASPGDILDVPVEDVIATPDLYRSTCGKPFIRNGNSLIDPCIGFIEEPTIEKIEPVEENYGVPDIVSKWDDTEHSLEEEFGPMAATALVNKYGHISIDEVYNLDESEIAARINKRIAKIITRRKEKRDASS